MSGPIKPPIPVLEIRLDLRPEAPWFIRFELTVREGVGGPITKMARHVHPKDLQTTANILLRQPGGQRLPNFTIVGILGDPQEVTDE